MRKPALIRSLGVVDATSLIVGCIVGVGIFRTASAIAGHLPSPSLILILWILGGLLSLSGGLCYAELASMFPASGGDYVYIREVYGKFWGFLFGWTKLSVERTGTIAILGFVFAEYLHRAMPYPAGAMRWVAAGAILLLTAVNVRGLRWGKYVQNTFTVLKIATLGSLIAVGFSAAFHQPVAGPAPTPTPLVWGLPSIDVPLIQSMGVALVFVLWTYGGWTEAGYVAEEIRQPQRNVPRAIIAGVLLTTGLYLLVNWSYLVFIPIEQLPHSPLVASTVMQRIWGSAGAVFIAWMVACSAFGALNGYILTGGRILYAIGKDHPLFARLGTIHRDFHTPALALSTNAVLAIALVFTKTFEQIVTYSTVVISIFFVMAVFGLIRLRTRRPLQPRAYRVWGYPFTPLLFIVTTIGFILNLCVQAPRETLFGFGLLALGLPLYRISNRAAES